MNNKDNRELNWAGEPVPTEAEQNFWSWICVLWVVFSSILIAILMYYDMFPPIV